MIEWPDTFEDFIAKYSICGEPLIIDAYLVFQGVEHYFPTKECRTCKYYDESSVTTQNHGYCYWEHAEDRSGYVRPYFGCVDWRARE